MPVKRMLIIEDDRAMQALYRALFKRMSGLEIGAIVPSGTEALAEIERRRPDIVVIDIGLPGVGGLELCGMIRKRMPHAKILIATAHQRELHLDAARDAGADELITKGSAAELRTAVRRMIR